MRTQPETTPERHLTPKQREDISAGLHDSISGPVSLTAVASDQEAVSYQAEIATVLEDTGFEVEIENTKRATSLEEEPPAGLEMTVSDETIRPGHASRIVHAFRRAGVAIATRINAKRKKKDTLYITVGPNDGAACVLPITSAATPWPWKSLTALLAKWRN